jgi:hypothetical protein
MRRLKTVVEQELYIFVPVAVGNDFLSLLEVQVEASDASVIGCFDVEVLESVER